MNPGPAIFPAVSPLPSLAGGYDVLFNSIAQQEPPFPPVELVVIDELAHHRSQVRFFIRLYASAAVGVSCMS